MIKNALLEIGTEEIPASYLEPARRQLAEMAETFLKEHRVTHGGITVYTTPRRIALLIKDLAEKSEDRVEEMSGPSVKAGRDPQGNFTMAAKGFAAKHGVAPEKLAVKTTEKGEYFTVVKKIPGEKTDKLLAAAFPEMIGKIYFPKTMVWGSSGFRFARPIRTLAALFGSKVIRFALAGIKSADWSIGLHTFGWKKFKIAFPDKYIETLRNHCVLVDQDERREAVRKAIEAVSRGKGTIIPDEGLVDEVTELVEHPVAVLATFDEKYLALPPEVLITCLRKKQKCFAVQDARGKLTRYFVGVRNGISESQDIVRNGYEKVLTARLADAEFFYKNDTRAPLEEKYEKLKGVVLQQKLGTIYDKTVRVEKTACRLRDMLQSVAGYAVDDDTIRKACRLAKSDLVTEMVFEYPELQGVVGRIYAARNNEPVNVAASVEQHYWPLTAEGTLPGDPLSVILSLADKMDTLAGDFAAGLIPSGSQDPYGLRRMAVGIIRMIQEKGLPLSLRALTDAAFELLPETLRANTAVRGQVMDFFRQRIENLLEARGFRFDEIRAVLATGYDDIADVFRRLEAVSSIRQKPDFAPIASAFKRASNILRQAEKNKIAVPESVDPSVLAEDAEKNLYAEVQRMESGIRSLLERRDYAGALQSMVGLKPTVDAFFDNVMVMAEDEKVKCNRLALLRYATRLFSSILDFSQLQG